MSIADYNSFGIIPITTNGAVAKIDSNAIVIESFQGAEYIRVHTKLGDKFVIVHAEGLPSADIYPYIITAEDGVINFYGQGNKVTNYTLEITYDMLGGDSGYIYFNGVIDISNPHHLLVYQEQGKNGLLHQAVQNELIMLIQKQLKEMSE